MINTVIDCNSILQTPCGIKKKMNRNAMEDTKNICCAKGEVAVDHSTVTRWFKKFRLSCKNLNYRTRSGGLKSVDSEAELQIIEVNPTSSTRRKSGELGIAQIGVVRPIPDLGSNWIRPHFAKILTHPSRIYLWMTALENIHLLIFITTLEGIDSLTTVISVSW